MMTIIPLCTKKICIHAHVLCSRLKCRPAKLHAFGMKVPHFTCSSCTNFSYIFYKFTHFRLSCSPYINFFKIAAVAAQIHAFYLLELGSYESARHQNLILNSSAAHTCVAKVGHWYSQVQRIMPHPQGI